MFPVSPEALQIAQNEGFSPTHNMNYVHPNNKPSIQNPNIPQQKMKPQYYSNVPQQLPVQNHYEQQNFQPYPVMQGERIEPQDHNLSPYNNYQDPQFFPIPVRGHSQSLHYHDHNSYHNNSPTHPYLIFCFHSH